MKNQQATRPGGGMLRANLSLFAVAIIWGSGFIGTQLALDAELSSSFIMFVRFAIATVVTGGIFWRDLKRELKPAHLKAGGIIGLCLFLGFFTQTVGLKYTTPSNNAFITASNVVIVPFLWWGLTKVRPKTKYFFSSVLCLVGIGILSVNLADGLSLAPGDLLTLGCAFFFACQIVATGKLARQIDTKVIVFLQFAVATVLSLVVFLVTDRDFTAFASPKGMLAVGYLGIFSTCLSYFLQTAAQKVVPSAKVAIILCTESLFGTLFSVLLGYDKLTLQMVVGGCVILASVLLTELRIIRRAPNKLEDAP